MAYLPYNFYDELGLDPSKKLSKAVMADAVEQWKTRINAQLRDQSKAALVRDKFNAIRSQIEIFPEDTAMQDAHKRDFEERHLQEVTQLAEFMKKLSGAKDSAVIARAAVRRIAQQSKLQPAKVNDAFKRAGFTVTEPPKAAPRLPKREDLLAIAHAVRELQDKQSAMASAIPAEISRVTNLYEFLEVLTHFEATGLTQLAADANAFSRMDHKALAGVFDTIGKKYSTGTTFQVHMRDISGKAKQFFKTPEGKASYDLQIQLDRSELKDAMQVLGRLPEALKFDTTFAKPWIERLQQVLRIGEDDAYAVYNELCGGNEAAFIEKEDQQIVIFCGACGRRHAFASLAEARRSKCDACQTALYEKCPGCGIDVLNGTTYCPACHYYIPGKRIFENALKAFRDACRATDVAEAKRQLALLKENKPQNVSIDAQEAEYKKLYETITASIAAIDALILENKLTEAAQQISALKQKAPDVDLAPQEQKLARQKKILDENRQRFEARMREIRAMPNARDRVRACFSLLQQDPGYKPALDELRSPALRPQPVSAVSCVLNSGSASIAWQANSLNDFVTYTVTRTEGGIVPQSPDGGTIVAKGLTTTAATDPNVPVGKIVCYYVFAVREKVDVFSQAAGLAKAVARLPGVTGLTSQVSGKECMLTWKLPAGCHGVRIERKGGNRDWAVVNQRVAGSSWTDTQLEVGVQYDYRCTALWLLGGSVAASTETATVTVTLTKRPDPVTLKLKQQGTDGLCELSWHASGSGPLEIWDIPASYTVRPGSEMPAAQLQTMGACVWSGLISQGQTTVNVGRDRTTQLVAVCPYSGNCVMGDALQVSTVGSLEVDTDGIRVKDGSAEIPVRATQRTKRIEIYLDNGDKPLVTVAGTGRDGVVRIQVPGLPQKLCELTVSGATTEGGRFAPTRIKVDNMPKVQAVYLLEWIRARLSRKLNGLNVRISTANGDSLPHCYLCCRKGNPIGAIAPTATVYDPATMTAVAEIPPRNGKEAVVAVDGRMVEQMPPNTRLKLLLAPDAADRFEPLKTRDANALTKPV